jgi:hypothetical protein
LNVQSSLPLFTSNARTSPLVLLWVATVILLERRADQHDVPTMVGSSAARSPVQFDLLALAGDCAFLEIDRPALAERRNHRAVLALSATRR